MELHTTCTDSRLQEDIHKKVELEPVNQCKGSGEDTLVVVDVGCKVGMVVKLLGTVEGSSYAADQKSAAVAHPPDCKSVVMKAKCLIVVAPAK